MKYNQIHYPLIAMSEREAHSLEIAIKNIDQETLASHRCISKGVRGAVTPPPPLEAAKSEFQGKSNAFSGQKDPLDCSKSI